MYDDYMKYKADEIELSMKLNPLYALLGIKTDKIGVVKEEKKHKQPSSQDIQSFFAMRNIQDMGIGFV